MTLKLPALHLIVGILTFLLFLLSGVYMRMSFPQIYQPNESIRFHFRANHIYILFSALLNVSLGLYLRLSVNARRLLMQRMGSWTLLTAPIIFVTAFLVEPPQASPYRPLTALAVFATGAGVLLHFLAREGKQQ